MIETAINPIDFSDVIDVLDGHVDSAMVRKVDKILRDRLNFLPKDSYEDIWTTHYYMIKNYLSKKILGAWF